MSSIDRRNRETSRSPSTTAILTLFFLTIITNPAIAARNANGAMLLHTDDAVNFSAGQDYCGTNPLPPTCEELNTTVNKDPNVEAMVWMVAAFADYSSPGVNAFQVGIAGDIPADYYTAFAPCGPGVLEIPDPTWPAPGTGTTCAFMSTVFDRLFKMYWFAAASPGVGSGLSTANYPGGDHHAEWGDDSNPPRVDFCYLFGTVAWGDPGHNDCPIIEHVGACCFLDGHCEVRDQTACNGVYQGDGTTCPPNPPCPPPVGACCLNGDCIGTIPEAECEALGGEWQGFGIDCATGYQCPPITGACCLCEVCSIETPADCIAIGGEYKGDGTNCIDAMCAPPPSGACCVNYVCTIEAEDECSQMGGTYYGICSVCDPTPCPPPSSIERSTWGRIKGKYR